MYIEIITLWTISKKTESVINSINEATSCTKLHVCMNVFYYWKIKFQVVRTTAFTLIQVISKKLLAQSV